MLATAESEHGMTTLRDAIRFTQALVRTGMLCSALAVSFSALALDEEAGKKKAEQVCAGCHGPAGNKPVMPDTPRLAGQHYDYLMQALAAYRKGSRQNPIMSAMAQPLTEQEIRELALYYSTQQGLVIKY
jgi:cytochrome c553